MSGLHIIWFRNDLRAHDHAALRGACHAADRDGGTVLALYIASKNAAEDSDAVRRSAALDDLRVGLEQRGALLHLREGKAHDVFSELHRLHGIRSLHMHDVPFEDEEAPQIESWALRAGVAFRTYPQFGPAEVPDAFTTAEEQWDAYMTRPRFETPDIEDAANIGIGRWAELGQTHSEDRAPQEAGGRRRAIELLRAFLGSVADPQRLAITEANSGAAFYDVLKPFLKLGVLSIREVWQAASSAHYQMRHAGQDIRAASIKSFLRRLPELHQSHRPKSARNPHGRAPRRPSKGQQLSLGL
jgi:deoxyribodipyrimidine photo-lyase